MTKLTSNPQLTSMFKDYKSLDSFINRHIGPNEQEIDKMLKLLGFSTLEALIDATIPPNIRFHNPLNLAKQKTEYQALQELKTIGQQNRIYRNYIGRGYVNCITPPVIVRNILENPGFYTSYTPYQAEISQGRLEALLNFQTMIMELTGLEIANASLLDEGTAAAEAMTMSYGICKTKANTFFVSETCHPQTIEVIKTRALPLEINIIIGDHRKFDFSTPIFGALLQYPATDGTIYDYREFIGQVHDNEGLVTIAADLLSLALLTPPGELGADIAVGSSQRFGVPLGFGGPHAAFFATKDAHKRLIPGRIVGVSKDAQGKRALRLALQTREQHIRRDKATSNICTAQVLLAVIASMYAIYHGPNGIKNIAQTVNNYAKILANGLENAGYKIVTNSFFDTVTVEVENAFAILETAYNQGVNLRLLAANKLSITVDETTSLEDITTLWSIFQVKIDLKQLALIRGEFNPPQPPLLRGEFNPPQPPLLRGEKGGIPENLVRKTPYLTDPIFNQYHSETELLRYLKQLENKDLSLTHSMIPLGSCTMKLNASSEMLPVTWPEFNQIHPFAPSNQIQGYLTLFSQLESWLGEITGFAGVSLQPNAGSQGEYAGLQVIMQYHRQNGDLHRHICLIPESAHGTNPASAVMCGLKVIGVKCDAEGNIDFSDLEKKASKYADNLAALMITYPSTHGVFEENVREICQIIHKFGGQVYLDGANMNAQVGLCRPGDYGADVCHLNLHKTFCIPHGGGGPGVGPIGVASHLLPFLPSVSLENKGQSMGMISAAPWGSASILPISWMYIAMMGGEGLKLASQVAILNANYIAYRLQSYYPILFKGKSGLVAHECIVDLRHLKKLADISVDDIAKRLMDYGFHAPTVSWPVAGTMMIEPTESESLDELDRFCDAMISIRQEIEAIATGELDSQDNPLKNAPHTAESLICGDWEHSYPRELAAYPAPWTKTAKFWPSVARIDNAWGDRNLICSCSVEINTEE